MKKSKKIAIGILAAVVALMIIGAFAEDKPAIEIEHSKVYNSHYHFHQDALDIRNIGEKPVSLTLKDVNRGDCRINTLTQVKPSYSFGQSLRYLVHGCDRILEATVTVDGQDYVYEF